MKLNHCFLFAIAVFAAHAAQSQIVSLSSQNQGWYDSTGFNDPANPSYVVGFAQGGGPFRSYFTFDAAGLAGRTVTNATLKIFNPPDGFGSFQRSETVSVFSFDGAIASLVAGTGDVAAFNDLGSGTLFGAQTVSVANNDAFVSFTLNGDFLSYITGSPGAFALGISLSSLSADLLLDQYVFAFSGDASAELDLTVSGMPPPPVGAVPEPMAYGVVCGLSLVAFCFRRKVKLWRRAGLRTA